MDTYERALQSMTVDDYWERVVASGWLNDTEVLQDSGGQRKILQLPACDQNYYLVVVTSETYRNAERLMVIPPPTYFLDREG